jgi:hypothetical protein
MELFELSLHDTSLGLGGDANFRTVFGGTEVIRYREAGVSEVSWPVNEVQIRNGQFTRGDDFARWTFIHEFGHRFDVTTGLTASLALESYTDSSTTGIGCGLPGVDLMGHCTWNPNGGSVSDYALTSNRREDWSESFAASMFQGDWANLVSSGGHGIRPDALTVAADRIDFVRQVIDSILPAIDAAPSWGEP